MKSKLFSDELLKQFINKHLIREIGDGEFIVDAPLEFINIISNSNIYIRQILWWEHIEITKKAQSLGGGGPIDPMDCRFMYSEVYYEAEDFSENDIELCKKYLLEIPNKYPGHKLVPSFITKKRN